MLNAAPEWRLGGKLLSGAAETVELKATKASLTIPGLTTTCEPFVLELGVENPGGGGAGAGKVTGVHGGAECALSETEVVVTGSAGGVVNDIVHTVTFSSSTFLATGTQLKALGSKLK